MKKIMLLSILVTLIFVTIFLTTAIGSNVVENVTKKESPLYSIRTVRAIQQKIRIIIENIKTKFLGERIFFMPKQLFLYKISSSIRDDIILDKVWSAGLCTIFAPCTSYPGVPSFCDPC